MYLKKIKIKGFTSIKNQEIVLNQVNVLIGSNGSGKSNFISVFDFLDAVFKKQLSAYSYQYGSGTLLYCGKESSNQISIELIFNNGTSYGFDFTPTKDCRLVIKREFYSNGAIYADVTDGIHAESAWEQCGDEKLCQILKASNWQMYHFNNTNLKSKVGQICDISANTFLQADVGNLAAILYRLKAEFPKSYNQIVDCIQLIAPSCEDFYLKPQGYNGQQIRLHWIEQRQDQNAIRSISQLSDGIIQFICLATLLLQPVELRPAIIIMDSPEIGLYPALLHILAEMVRLASLESQILLSTHSPVLLDQFNPEDVLVVSREGNGTEFSRLNEEELRDWMEDYSLGELWKKNIFGGRAAR